MKNENSDEKVTSINPVNQSYRAYCMQLAEPLNKMTWLLDCCWFRGVMLNWCELLTNFLTDDDPAIIPVTLYAFTLCLHMETPEINIEAEGCRNEKSMTTNIHYRKAAPRFCVFACLGSGQWVAKSESTLDVGEWVIGVSPFSAAVNLFMWTSVLPEGLAKSVLAGDANTTYPFYFQVWNIKWSFNGSRLHLSGILTALEMWGRGWNTDKWRAVRIKRSWIKARRVTFRPKKLNSVLCSRFFDWNCIEMRVDHDLWLTVRGVWLMLYCRVYLLQQFNHTSKM